MAAREFGQLIEAERLRRGWTRSKLAVAVGILDDGSALDATQIRRIVQGTRKLDQDIVRRLIEALDLDADLSWHAAGIWPPDLDVEGYRRFRQRAFLNSSDRDALMHRLGKPQGRVKRMGLLLPFPLPALELGRVA